MSEARSPLSADTQALLVEAQAWGARERKIREQRQEVLIALQPARIKYEELLGELMATGGTLTEAARQRARTESVGELEEQLQALEHALRAIPELKKRAFGNVQAAAEKEKRGALDRLAQEWRALVRKELLPPLRALYPFLMETDRIALQAKAWSQEGIKPGDYHGHSFPIPGISVHTLIRYLLAVHGTDLQRGP